MAKRRVFILYSHPLFAKGIESLLHQEAGLEVASLSLDQGDLLEAVKAFGPDVVIIDSDPQVVAQLVPRLLQQHPGLKVVGMTPGENEVTVHYRQQERVTTIGDLVGILEESRKGVVNPSQSLKI